MATVPSSDNLHRPLWQILLKQNWSDPWKPMGMAKRWLTSGVTHRTHGWEVMRYRRRSLPDIGEAQIRFRFGRINGRDYDGVDGLVVNVDGYYVRIRVAPLPTDEQSRNIATFSPAWTTTWMGRMLYRETRLKPGGAYLIGEHVFHCLELLSIADRWPMVRHGHDFGGSVGARIARGHPGYNLRRSNGTLAGNRGTSTIAFTPDCTGAFLASARCHTWPAIGSLFTDMEAVNHAIVSSRTQGSPQFLLSDPAGAFDGASAMEVDDRWSCLAFLRQVLRRERGKGNAFLGFAGFETDLTKNPDLTLWAYPQRWDDITYTDPVAGGSTTILGAASLGTVATVDLQGDHRNVDAVFRLGDASQHTLDYCESQGNRIQGVVTVGYPDNTTENAWSSSQETAFMALSASQRIGNTFLAVFQLHRLVRTWDGTCGDGNGGTKLHADFRCEDTAAISAGDPAGLPDASPYAVTILPDLPSLTPTDDLAGKNREAPRCWIRVGADRFLDAHVHGHLSMAIRPDGMLVFAPPDQLTGYRLVGPFTSSAFAVSQLVWTVCLELPHRIRMASGDPAGSRKRTFTDDDLHLHLVARNAITKLNLVAGDGTGIPPVRDDPAYASGGVGSNWRLIRDDRTELARRQSLRWSWYGQVRRTLTYALRTEPTTDTLTTHPDLGEVVDTLAAGGESLAIRTPVTSIDMDVEGHRMTVTTDWSELDLR